jgi:phosphatidylglycerol:prolipoprotein diacylglycerol transferase
MIKRCEQTGLSSYHILGASIYSMIGGLIGARIFYLFENLYQTIENPMILMNVFGGTTSWGAYLVGTGGFFLYFKLYNIPSLRYADVLGSSLGLGPFFGRLSCFLHGCCIGTMSDSPWAVCYPPESYAYSIQLKKELITSNASLSLGIHPFQLYLSVSGLIVFIIASKFWRRRQDIPGLTLIFYWLLYCLLRFMLEYFRGEADRHTSFMLTVGQLVCLGIIILSVIGLVYIKKIQYKNS